MRNVIVLASLPDLKLEGTFFKTINNSLTIGTTITAPGKGGSLINLEVDHVHFDLEFDIRYILLVPMNDAARENLKLSMLQPFEENHKHGWKIMGPNGEGTNIPSDVWVSMAMALEAWRQKKNFEL